jgi:hypothetical protein
VLGTLILLTRGSLAVFTIFLQPYYSFKFTDLRAGLFTGEVEFPRRPLSPCWAPIANRLDLGSDLCDTQRENMLAVH